jgi:hypothetical protein
MAFPFSVGNGSAQSLLDWVAEPPPAQARDTHALRFRLFNDEEGEGQGNQQYTGLLFYRPPGVGTSLVGRRPGLDGWGSLLVTEGICRKLLDNPPAFPKVELVRVFVAFVPREPGPAQVIATLQLWDGDLNQMPIQQVGDAVEFSHIEMSGSGFGITMLMDPPQGWSLLLTKTAVLLRRP